MVMTAADCRARFLAAVRDGRNNDYRSASAIVERVRRTSGDDAAERAKRELWAYIRSSKRA